MTCALVVDETAHAAPFEEGDAEAVLVLFGARREAERGTFDPTYLVYSVGKLMLLKLRQECKQQQGKSFSLRSFHDTLLAQGTAPFWLHRQMMLGEEGDLLD